MSPPSPVLSLTRELKEACRRPLFAEICLEESKLDFKALLLAKAGHKQGDLPRQESSAPQPPVSSSVSSSSGGKKPEKKSWREVGILLKLSYTNILTGTFI